MFRITGGFQHLKLKQEAYTKKFEEQAQIMIRNATREFVKEVFYSVPVWTGFARGSIKLAEGEFGPLALYLRVALPESRLHDRPKYYRHITLTTPVLKIPSNAGRFAHYSFDFTRHRYVFSFKNDLTYFFPADFFGLHNTGPWESITRGLEAFRLYMLGDIPTRFPKIKDYMDRVVFTIQKT